MGVALSDGVWLSAPEARDKDIDLNFLDTTQILTVCTKRGIGASSLSPCLLQRHGGTVYRDHLQLP